MDTPLSAAAVTAGALISNGQFSVPPFQRDYAWREDEIGDFWSDLKLALDSGQYFLGLVILTDEGFRKEVVDGQQRLLTLSLLAAAVYHEAVRAGRRALAEKVRSDFLYSIDYETDKVWPRIELSDSRDNQTFQKILSSDEELDIPDDRSDQLSPRLASASRVLRANLRVDLSSDPFKRLGEWADFLTNKLYFAAFVHPDPASAYRVFEVINTRGRGLTTADLLKNYILSQIAPNQRDRAYETWTTTAKSFETTGPGTFVQFIRHVTTLSAGYILPRDLFDYLAARAPHDRSRPRPPSAAQLVSQLERWAPLYNQMIDPTVAGPADPEWLGVFAALNDLNVLSVRPVLMSFSQTAEATRGMRQILRLVVRRIVVGNLGTGSVERRFGDAAKLSTEHASIDQAMALLKDLDPATSDLREQLRKRSFNKSTLSFLRRSILQRSQTPEPVGFLHLVRPRQAPDWTDFPDDEFTYWGSTIGNTILASEDRRPRNTATWSGFKKSLLPLALADERRELFDKNLWSASAVEDAGFDLAEAAVQVWK